MYPKDSFSHVNGIEKIRAAKQLTFSVLNVVRFRFNRTALRQAKYCKRDANNRALYFLIRFL